MNHYVVMDKAARMPSTCWGRYRKVAVVETDLPHGAEPKMISTRAKGLVRIVERWDKRSVGLTAKSAYARALAEATVLANRLNEGAIA